MRICLFGGPGSAKDTTASYLFAKLKTEHVNIELVPEFVKSWTYIHRNPTAWDQPFIFGSQLQKEYEVLEGGFKHLITPCPILLNAYYSKSFAYDIYRPEYKKWFGEDIYLDQISTAMAFNKRYPSLNIFLRRGDIPYTKIGRFHTKSQALKIDRELEKFLLEECKTSLVIFDVKERESIYDFVKEAIDNDG